MALTVTTPATIFDMADLSGARSRVGWAVAREMWKGGSTYAVRRGDELICLAGIYPLGNSAGEAWFEVSPEGRRHMLALCRAVKLTIAASGYREIVAVCTSEAGIRIARAIGMKFFGKTELGEIWSCHNCLGAETDRPNSSSKPSSADLSPT